jgi:hypothetical protein
VVTKTSSTAHLQHGKHKHTDQPGRNKKRGPEARKSVYLRGWAADWSGPDLVAAAVSLETTRVRARFSHFSFSFSAFSFCSCCTPKHNKYFFKKIYILFLIKQKNLHLAFDLTQKNLHLAFDLTKKSASCF